MTLRQQPDKSLNEVLAGLDLPPLEQDIMLTELALDSRRLIGGELFLAVPGFSSDGRDYIDSAIASGAAAVLAEMPESGLPDTRWEASDTPVIFVSNLKSRVGVLAHRFYRQPSEDINLVGVTGTNGKTSCCWFVAQLLSRLNKPCAIMGTIGMGVPPQLEPCLNTTSDAVSVQQFLVQLKDQNIPAMAMEVSSHGLDQGRADGLCFDVGVFTNISRDHLDYHKTLDAYAEAKSLLFANGRVKYAVINLDDDYSERMIAACNQDTQVITFSITDPSASIFASDIQLDQQGLTARLKTCWGEGVLKTPQLGRFSLENLLAVIGAVCVQGYSLDSVLALIPELTTVPGRMQRMGGGDKPLVVVDYAHTPDALSSVLKALREHGADRLICVFGCGGDRDRGKRPLMTQAAVEGAEQVVVTSDNPRSEDPEQIIQDALEGISEAEKSRITTITDRADAIQQTVMNASAGDIIVVAGKGHEDYQEVNGVRHPFDDRIHVQAVLDGWSDNHSIRSAV